MLKLSDFPDVVLIQYHRLKNGTPKGVLVAIGPGEIGWALCGHDDTFKKSIGLGIALGRAVSFSFIKEEQDSFNCFDKVPQTLQHLAKKMFNRSFLYFQFKNEE